MKTTYLLTIVLLVFSKALTGWSGVVHLYPAPAGEELSKSYNVRVEGRETPVYLAKVACANPTLRWKEMDDPAHSADYFETASFASFDMEGTIKVTVTTPDVIQSAKVLPSSYKITPQIDGKTLTFTLSQPKLLTIEFNGQWTNALHLFANAPETNAPKPGDPNVIFFGPGLHKVSHLVVTNNQTVYIAGGAIVQGIIDPQEPFSISSFSGLRNYSPTFSLEGDHITFRGRGILDGGLCPTHARHLLSVRGKDINLEGVILRDSSTWTIPIRQSERVTVKNMKLLGRRANSDGIDICNSRDVTVDGCFIRTLDDLIVVKTDSGQGESSHITAKNCVLWNEVAHALSLGAELRENVSDVLFTNCDVIHDKGREWTLRVYHCDSARISDVRFENIRIEESPRLLSLWIGKAMWTKDPERGHISNIFFKNIQATATPLSMEMQGFDKTHLIDNVLFENVLANGNLISLAQIKTNEFVKNIICKP